MIEEIYKHIIQFPDYMVSNMGNVKSIRRNIVLKQILEPQGYLTVNLYLDKKLYSRRVHVLVWDTFSDTPRNGRKLQVDHIDEDKLNNKFYNLQLLDNQQNCAKGRLKYKKNGLPSGVGLTHNSHKKYRAYITINHKYIHIGYYATIEEAQKAYLDAKNTIGFSNDTN